MVGASSFLELTAAIRGGSVLMNEERGWRAGDTAHAAGEEITVDQLETEYLHVDPVLLAGWRGFCCQKTLLLYA
jgi:hypothetical protein